MQFFMLSTQTRISDASCDAQQLLQISQNTRDIVPVVVTAASLFTRDDCGVWFSVTPHQHHHQATTSPPTTTTRPLGPTQISSLTFRTSRGFEANASRCISLRRRHTGLHNWELRCFRKNTFIISKTYISLQGQQKHIRFDQSLP